MPNPLNIELLDRALSLKEGEEIEIPFQTLRHLESARTSLFREKGFLVRDNACYYQVTISKVVDEEKGIFTIILSKRAPLTEVTIIAKDGSRRTETLVCDPDLERALKLMKEDGASDNEIEEFKKSYQTMEENNG